MDGKPQGNLMDQLETASGTSQVLGSALLGVGGGLMVLTVFVSTPLMEGGLLGSLLSGLVGVIFILLGLYIRSIGRMLGSLHEAFSQVAKGESSTVIGQRNVPNADRIAAAVNEISAAIELGEEDDEEPARSH
jgi:hypothetical protein